MVIPVNTHDVPIMKLKLKMKMKMMKKENVRYLAAYPLFGDLMAAEVLLKEVRNLEQENKVVVRRCKRNFRECLGHIHYDIYNILEDGECSRTYHQCCSDHHHHCGHQPQQQEEEVAVQEKKQQEKKKKAVKKMVLPPPDHDYSQVPPDLPENFKNRIRQLEGSEPMFVAQKRLTKTDMDSGQARLLLPFSLIKNPEFLTPEEKHFLNSKSVESKCNGKLPGIRVPLIEPSGEEQCYLTIKRWDMPKREVGRVNSSYSFVSGWNSVVSRNMLQVDTVLQVWSFRVESELWFAFVKLN